MVVPYDRPDAPTYKARGINTFRGHTKNHNKAAAETATTAAADDEDTCVTHEPQATTNKDQSRDESDGYADGASSRHLRSPRGWPSERPGA